MMEADEEPLIFTLDMNDPEKIVRDFVEALFVRREIATTLKYSILEEYFTWLQAYEDAHFNYFAGRGLLPFDYCRAKGYRIDGPELDRKLDAWAEEAMCELANDLDSRASSDDDDEYTTEEEEEMEEVVVSAAEKRHYGGGGGGSSSRSHEPGEEKTDEIDKKTEARLIQEICKAWEFSIFGILQKRLHYLARSYNCFSYNGERFDCVLLCASICTYAKQSGRKKVSIHRQAATIRHILIDGIRIADIKRLCPPGFDLSNLAKLCKVKENKGIFPFSKLDSFEFLLSPSLPRQATDWTSDLNGKTVSQEQVDEALALFEERQFPNVLSYLQYYLSLDCLLLQQIIIALGHVYYDILNLHFIDSKKYTVSSFSSMGAQTFLARHLRPGSYFPNHARTYSVSPNHIIHSYHFILIHTFY